MVLISVYDSVDALLLYSVYFAIYLLTENADMLNKGEKIKSLGFHFGDLVEFIPWKNSRIHLVYVPKWAGFVTPLNMLLSMATEQKYTFIGFLSLEVTLDKRAAEILLSEFNDGRTLVVGSRLNGHFFIGEGSCVDETWCDVELNGVTSPWNTLAFWKVAELAKTGFLAISDGVYCEGKLEYKGVEEIVTISLLQMLNPGMNDAKLVDVQSGDVATRGSGMYSRDFKQMSFEERGDFVVKVLDSMNSNTKNGGFNLKPKSDFVRWDIDFSGDAKRIEWHQRKMATKYFQSECAIKFSWDKRRCGKA